MVFTHQNVPGTRSESDATPATQVCVLFTYSMEYFVGEEAAMDLVTEIWRGPYLLSLMTGLRVTFWAGWSGEVLLWPCPRLSIYGSGKWLMWCRVEGRRKSSAQTRSQISLHLLSNQVIFDHMQVNISVIKLWCVTGTFSFLTPTAELVVPWPGMRSQTGHV